MDKNKKHSKFYELPHKEKNIYLSLLTGFINEIKDLYQAYILSKLVGYLWSKYDFYRVISIDKKRTTKIQAYNLHGSLNQNSKSQKISFEIPVVSLPHCPLGFVLSKTNTVELYMDQEWQFSFRIHNAAKLVELSLKFDI